MVRGHGDNFFANFFLTTPTSVRDILTNLPSQSSHHYLDIFCLFREISSSVPIKTLSYERKEKGSVEQIH